MEANVAAIITMNARDFAMGERELWFENIEARRSCRRITQVRSCDVLRWRLR